MKLGQSVAKVSQKWSSGEPKCPFFKLLLVENEKLNEKWIEK